jgi:hypothetical protein
LAKSRYDGINIKNNVSQAKNYRIHLAILQAAMVMISALFAEKWHSE